MLKTALFLLMLYNHFVTVTWIASVSCSGCTYNIYRGVCSGTPYATGIVATVYIDPFVSPAQSYTYWATTVQGGQESGCSNSSTITVPTTNYSVNTLGIGN